MDETAKVMENKKYQPENNLDKNIEMNAGTDDSFVINGLSWNTKDIQLSREPLPQFLPNHVNHCTDSVGIVSASACYAG